MTLIRVEWCLEKLIVRKKRTSINVDLSRIDYLKLQTTRRILYSASPVRTIL